jgi:tRNA threonylcarbamoyladenosine biosynthesis protein TsaE
MDMVLSYELILNNLNQTKNLAIKIAEQVELGDVITLSGDLGVGKTTFVQYFINHVANQSLEVTSPTFNLLHVYNLDKLSLWHFDLYRIKNIQELYELGIEEAFDSGVSLVEWPELVAKLLPKNRLELDFSFLNNLQSRKLNLRAYGKWKELCGDKKWLEMILK